jgi:hypothetical protein
MSKVAQIINKSAEFSQDQPCLSLRTYTGCQHASSDRWPVANPTSARQTVCSPLHSGFRPSTQLHNGTESPPAGTLGQWTSGTPFALSAIITICMYTLHRYARIQHTGMHIYNTPVCTYPTYQYAHIQHTSMHVYNTPV